MDFDEVRKVSDRESFSVSLENMADELPYTFGVRACSSEDICSDNVNTITRKMVDGGAPKTTGVSKAEIVDGKVQITIPWEEANGAVKKRVVYRSTSDSLASFKIISTILIDEASLINPQTTYRDITSQENTTYYYMVRDIDPSNNSNNSVKIVSIATGDLTAPTFLGITDLQSGTPADDALRLTWTAIDPNDAKNYLVYLTTTTTTPNGPITTPTDSCTTGSSTLFTTIASSAYAKDSVVNYNLTGLNPRTTYRVCVKARDAALNISDTTVSMTLTTKDITPPDFDGIQEVKFEDIVKIKWNPSNNEDNDLDGYKVIIWKNTETPNEGDLVTKYLSKTSYSNSYSFDKTVFPYADNDKIYVIVMACDDAPVNFGTQNCSNYPINGLAATTTTKALQLGDTTKPVFSGISSLDTGTPADKHLNVVWKAIASQQAGVASGASFYLIYRTEADGLNTPDDACTSKGVLVQTLQAGNYIENNMVTFDMGGLSERKSYNVCVKAKDLAGNISDTTKSLAQTTKDITPPVFGGVTSYKYEDSKMKVRWTASTSSDVLEYQVKIWKNNSTGTGATTITKAHITNPTGFDFDKTNFSYTDGDKVYVLVNACDNAAPNYGSKNCTAIDVSQAYSVQLDDTTPPTFSGITGIELVDPKDQTIKIKWEAIASQPTIPQGAYKYLFYQVNASGKVVIADNPCTEGVGQYVGFEMADQFTAGTTATSTISSLNERTTYKFCVKAQDQAGNISNTDVSMQINTNDITAPNFGGILGFNYSESSSKLVLYWSGSSDADALEYKVSLWKNKVTPLPADITVKTVSHADHPTGWEFDSTDFAYVDGETVYAVVSACDNASPNFGTQNCTTINYADAYHTTLPDLTPPAGFSGIATAGFLTTPAEGQIVVTWIDPGNWTDYRGFIIYGVNADNSLTAALKTCPCVQANCSDKLLSCTLTGLDNYRNYTLHVRAYDAANNITKYLNPATSKTLKRTIDVTPPVFSSNIQSAFNSTTTTLDITWNTATDNQYNGDGNTIRYFLYQKTSAFANASTPDTDGTLVQSTTATSYKPTLKSLTQGSTYYYAVCAQDAATNRTCDGLYTQKQIIDNTDPTLTNLIITNKAASSEDVTWDLEWTASDNNTPTDQIVVKIYRKFTDTKTDFPDATDLNFWAQKAGNEKLSTEKNSDNSGNYIYATYRVIIKDLYGFTKESTLASKILPNSMQFGTSAGDFIQKTVVDEDGNQYMTGYTSGAFTGFTNAGGTDVFIAKINLSGQIDWIQQFGTSGYDYCMDLVVYNGYVYVVGYTGGSFTGYTSGGSDDPFIAKFGTDGTKIWVKQYVGSSSEYFNSIVIDNNNKILVGGHAYGGFYSTSNGGYDFIYGEYDLNGNLVVGKNVGTASNENNGRVKQDKNSGAIYIYGQKAQGTYDPGSCYLGFGVDYYYTYIVKITSLGSTTISWSVNFGTSGGYTMSFGSDTFCYGFTSSIKDIGIDNSGNVYIVGNNQTAQNNNKAFYGKYNSSGTNQFLNYYGNNNTIFSGIKLYDSNAYVIGYTSELLGTTSYGGNDFLVEKFSTTGTTLKTLQYGTTNGDYLYGITFHEGVLYATGYSYGAVFGANRGSSDGVNLEIDPTTLTINFPN